MGRVFCAARCGGEVARAGNNVDMRAEERVGLAVWDIPQG
jgi:hypothetical protein